MLDLITCEGVGEVCSFWESVSLTHATCSPPIGKRFELGGVTMDFDVHLRFTDFNSAAFLAL